MTRLIALGVLITLLSACVGTGELPSNAESRLGKVGVVALVGDELTLAHTGMSGFTSGARAVNIQPWEMDQFVVAELAMLLRERGYQVVETDYSSEELSPIYVSRPGSLDWKTANVEGELSRIAGESEADTLILVLRRSSPDFIHQTDDDEEHYRLPLAGIGLYDRRTLISHVITAAFANLEVVVLDAQTLRPVAERIAQQYASMPDTFWHEGYTQKEPQIPPENQPPLQEEMENILAVTLEQAVVELNL
jgi:hypothetical protein